MMEPKDPAICRRILTQGAVKNPEPCAATRMGLRVALPMEDERRKRHIRTLHEELNDEERLRDMVGSIWSNAEQWLPPVGGTEDLYWTMFVSSANALSMTPAYMGCSCLGAGSLLSRLDYREWFDRFGVMLLQTDLRERVEHKFVWDSIMFGRRLVLENCTPTLANATITRLAFQERGLVVPIDLGQLAKLEADHPDEVIETYFELATRVVRGTNSIAYTLTYCLLRIATDPALRKDLSVRSTTAGKAAGASVGTRIRSFVLETLRVNPPIGRVGRNTVRPVRPGGSSGNLIPPDTHVVFDITSYNRSSALGGREFRLPSVEGIREAETESGLQRASHKMATFGSYSPQRCPAAEFSVRVISCMLKALIAYRNCTIVGDLEGAARQAELNQRLQLAAEFTLTERGCATG